MSKTAQILSDYYYQILPKNLIVSEGQYIPKGTDFNELSDEFIAEVEWKLNNRPRKSLGYLTPLEYCKKNV